MEVCQPRQREESGNGAKTLLMAVFKEDRDVYDGTMYGRWAWVSENSIAFPYNEPSSRN